MSEDSGNTKRRRGRPKGASLSKRELAQRQSAAVKTGEHSQRLLGSALPPCKPAVCPAEGPNGAGFPCEVKKAVDAGGGGLAVCLVSMGESDVAERFRRAIAQGDTSALGELASLSLGAWSVLEQRELQKALQEGLTIERPIVGQTEEGPQVLGHVVAANPRIEKLLEISKLLGRTAADQVITPKARGEKAANEGVGKIGHAAWINSMRRGLSREDEADAQP